MKVKQFNKTINVIKYLMMYMMFLITCLFNLRNYNFFLRLILIELFIVSIYLVVNCNNNPSLKSLLKIIMSIVLYALTWFIVILTRSLILETIKSVKFRECLLIIDVGCVALLILLSLVEYRLGKHITGTLWND